MTNPTSISIRISRTATITLHALVNEVFPLFGPIRESEWATGWNPQILFSTSDLVEEHMVFKTQSHLGHGEPEYIWTVTKYMIDQGLIEYQVYTPERVWWITILCKEIIPDAVTRAEITYTYTGLTSLGNAINERALQSIYAHDLKDWETAINHYVKTGERLEHRKL